MAFSNGDTLDEAAERLAVAVQSVILSRAQNLRSRDGYTPAMYRSTSELTTALSHLLSEISVIAPTADPFGGNKPAVGDVTRASLFICEFAASLVDERMPQGVRDWFLILAKKADLLQTTAFDLGLDSSGDL